MKEKPIPRNAKIITKDMLTKIGINGALIGISILALMKWHFLGGTPEMQSTIVFSSLVFFALWNSFNCREFGYDSIIPNFTKNKVALILVCGAGLVQIGLVQIAGKWFDSVPLPLEIWITIIVFTFNIVVISEILKLFGSFVIKNKNISTTPREN
jgi:Ca2+-transporting ATPase